MANDFDIIDATKDAVSDIKKTFGKKTPWIIGGGILLAVGAGFFSLRKTVKEPLYYDSGGSSYPVDPGGIGISAPSAPESGFPADTGGTNAAMESFFMDLINMQMDTSDMIYSQAAQIDRLTARISQLSTEETTVYMRDELPDISNLFEVNQGVAGRRVLESAETIEARQRERYERAKAAGNEKYMEIVKQETEAAIGKKVDWDNKSSSSSSSSNKIYVEGGITYEQRDGKIYKDGRLIPEKDYKYIPKQVGGLRD